MNLIYKYPSWFNQKIFIYSLLVGITFHSLPFIFSKGAVELSAVLSATILWLGTTIIYVLANRNESSFVSITAKGVVVQKQLLKWSEIEKIEQTTDGADGLLLLIPILGPKLGNCLKIITNSGAEYFIYNALENYQGCVERIKERIQ